MARYTVAAFADEADRTLDGQIAALTRNGIGYLEIRGVDGISISDVSVGKAKEIRRRLDGGGIKVWSVGSPVGKTEITAPFAPHYDKFLHTVEVADVLGAKNIRIFSFYHTGCEITSSLEDEVFGRLQRLADTVRDTGITLCHENEKEIYGDTAERCLKIHRAIPEIKAVFDPANFASCGQDVAKAWEMLEKHIAYLHIKDVDKDGTVVPAGCGVCDIPALCGKYLQNGGNVLTLEPHLTEFDGLEALEKGGLKSAIASNYASANDAFDGAASALFDILNAL